MKSVQVSLFHYLKRSGFFNIVESLHEWQWHWRCLRKGSFAQYGEDVFVWDYFKSKTTGTYIDIGANHPFKISNTYLLYRRGWRGVTVEPIPRLWRRHQKWRPDDISLNCAISDRVGSEKFVELTPGVLSTFDESLADEEIRLGQARLVRKYDVVVMTLYELFDQYFQDKKVDFMSIDTEGFDVQVLRGNDWSKLRPRLIVTETSTVGRGSTQIEVDGFLRRCGYHSINKFGCNTFYESQA